MINRKDDAVLLFYQRFIQQKKFEKIILVPRGNVLIYLSSGPGFRYKNSGEECRWV